MTILVRLSERACTVPAHDARFGFLDRRAVEDAAEALRTQLDLILDRAAALAATFLLPESTTRSYIILACMVLFVGFVQMFIGTCVWLLLSEIFPLSIRGFAMGIAVFVMWCTNAIISFLFPLLTAPSARPAPSGSSSQSTSHRWCS